MCRSGALRFAQRLIPSRLSKAQRFEAKGNCYEVQESADKGRFAMAGWRIEGQYFETCNCSFICPCIGSNLAALPTEGDCKAAITMRIDKGQKDGETLDGLSFIVLLYAPKAMIEGNITVG